MRFSLTVLFAVVLCVLASGCSSDSSAIDDSETTFSTPAEFEEANVAWAKTDALEDSDTEQLTEYFTDNPSVSENPLVEGDPFVYTSSDGTKRYYWVRGGATDAEWFCLEFDDYDVEMLSGLGEPFDADSTSS
ncbi:MAG: hypothetical protein AB8G99_25680 [Planctomycetaceae bacterium]